VVATLTVVVILALFALFRDVDLTSAQVKTNTADVRILKNDSSDTKADVREIRVHLKAIDRIERKLDRITVPSARNVED
jgi:hypothetical protein